MLKNPLLLWRMEVTYVNVINEIQQYRFITETNHYIDHHNQMWVWPYKVWQEALKKYSLQIIKVPLASRVDEHKTHDKLFNSRSPVWAITDLWKCLYGPVYGPNIKLSVREKAFNITMSYLNHGWLSIGQLHSRLN